MTLDVAFMPQGLSPGDVAGRTVVVIDVLRATTTICAALHHGAREVVVALDTQDAAHFAQTLHTEHVLLAGERNSLPIPGFHLGNSPGEMTAAAVHGKTVVMTTTNGTGALLVTAGASEVIVASAVNLHAAGHRARAALQRDGTLLILCAGRRGDFALDDAYIAGRLAVAALDGRRSRKGLNDAALVALDLVSRYGDRAERVLAMSQAGRELTALGFRADVEYAASVNTHPVTPVYHDRRVALVESEAA